MTTYVPYVLVAFIFYCLGVWAGKESKRLEIQNLHKVLDRAEQITLTMESQAKG